jgi:hypothetical protein
MKMHKLYLTFLICGVLGGVAHAQDSKLWPYPIPCRIDDGGDPDLFMMALGEVNTPIAQGTYDPAADRVILKDGTIKEHYYRDTLGITYYRPIDKTHFPLPPSGWCTWYYYYYDVTADEVKRNAKWISDNLKDYGARIVQIDDGWQRGPDSTRDWTRLHKGYFPNGMANIAAFIKSLGLVPGIWLAPHGQDNPEVITRYPNVFLTDPDGNSVSQTWEGKWLVDPTAAESEAYMKDLFKTLCDWGYDYFKIDGQPIVVQEYNAKKRYMKNPEDDTNALYRKTLRWMRDVMGPNRYLLGCWGIPIEGVGIMDGSRTGGDIVLGWGGFRTALRAVMQYYYQHNIAWYVDPDVMVLRSPLTLEQARVWATLQGLTGQALMATDRMMDLGEERVEVLRRIYPAVDIRPIDLFPSERDKRIWDLKVNHLGRQYDVVGVFNFDETSTELTHLKWADLGLPTDRRLHVFDFWNGDYLGAWEAGMVIDMLPMSCRVLTLLPGNGQIQLISTNRHITQGWIDLKTLNYNDSGKIYIGTSRIIRDDPYKLHFVFPPEDNYAVKNATARSDAGNLPVKVANHQGWATVTIESSRTTEIEWKVSFEPDVTYHYRTRKPDRVRAERVGLDGVDLTWSEQYYLNTGYQVYLNEVLQGFTPKAAFPLRLLDPETEYTASIRSVWEDGTVSEGKAIVTFSIESMIPDRISLSELMPAQSDGWNVGPPFGFVGDQADSSAIFLRPGMDITYKINGLFDRLTGQIKLTRLPGSEETIEIVIIGDGRQLWRGDPNLDEDAGSLDIDIAGVKTLLLSTTGTASWRSRTYMAISDAVLSR